MKTTRHSTFETNSSSTHSISISESTEIYASISPDEGGSIVLSGGDFGWEWRRYTDALTKANYCAVACRDNEHMTEMLVSVVKEHTGAKQVIVAVTDAYIDHQSYGVAHVAFQSPENLKEFIFNPKSVLFTGNDNSSALPNFYDMDLSDKTHCVTLEGSDMPYYIKFDDLGSNDKVDEIINALWARSKYNQFSDLNYGRYETDNTSEAKFSMKWRDTDRVENFRKNVLLIVHEKYDSKKEDYTLKDSKELKFKIETLPGPVKTHPYYT